MPYSGHFAASGRFCAATSVSLIALLNPFIFTHLFTRTAKNALPIGSHQ
jgi:hypothetical protein